MPLAVLDRVIFNLDGAIPQNARTNVLFLNNYFGDR
jgi:hypothetical protein